MKIVKVNSLPQTYEADTIYLVKSSTAGLVEIYVTNNDATDVRSLGMSQVGGGVDDLVYEPRTSNVNIGSADKGKLIEIQSGFSDEQLMANASTLGSGWWCYYKNATDTDIAFPREALDNATRNGSLLYTSFVNIPNSGFDTDTDWTKGSGWTIAGGKAQAVNASSQLTSTTASLTTGAMLKITITVTRTSGTLRVMGVTGQDITASGTHTLYLTAPSTTFYLTGITNFNGTVDNIVVEELTYVKSNSSATAAKWLGDGKITFSSYAASTASNAVLLDLIVTGTGLYRVQYTVERTAGDIRFSFNDEIDGTARNASGTYTEYVHIKTPQSKIHFEMVTQIFTGTITDITVSKVVGKVDWSEADGLMTVYPGEMRLLYSTGSQIMSKPVQAFRKVIDTSGLFLKPTGYNAFDVTLYGSGGNGLNIGKPLSFVSPGAYYLPGTGGAYAMARYKPSDLSTVEYATLGSPGSGGFTTFAKTKVGNGINGAMAANMTSAVNATSDGGNSAEKVGGTYSTQAIYGSAAGRPLNEPYTYSTAAQNLVGGAWNINANAATRGSNQTAPVTGTVACTQGGINKFVIEVSNAPANEVYALQFSGAATGSFSFATTGANDKFAVFFIGATSSLNFSLNAAGVYGTNPTFTFGNRPVSIMQEGSLRKSVYGGNGGYLELTQSFTNGDTPGGGGGLYIEHSGDTLGRGGSAQLIIEGVI